MRRGRKKALTQDERDQARAFKLAVWGRPCANCGAKPPPGDPGYMDSNHVVEKQELRRRGLPLYDGRNAMPICPILGGGANNCHNRHTLGFKRVKRSALSEENEAYAREVLGDYAEDYLSTRYPED